MVKQHVVLGKVDKSVVHFLRMMRDLRFGLTCELWAHTIEGFTDRNYNIKWDLED